MYRKVKIDKRIGAKKTELSEFCRNYKGKINHAWKGNKVSYRALHSWVERTLGKSKKCEKCGTINAKRYDWANKSKKYKRDIKDWIRLCRSCHMKYDEINKKLLK